MTHAGKGSQPRGPGVGEQVREVMGIGHWQAGALLLCLTASGGRATPGEQKLFPGETGIPGFYVRSSALEG